MSELLITSENELTAKQKKLYERLCLDAVRKAVAIALKKAEPDYFGLQKLIETGDEFQSVIIDVLVAKTCEMSAPNQYVNEEVKSRYSYCSGYKKPKNITQQTDVLRQMFPDIGFANIELAQKPLPEHAEGYFAIPRWQSIASTYGEAVLKVFELLKKVRNGDFVNCVKGEHGLQYLWQSAKTAKAFEKLAKEQKDYNVLVVPAQFGFLHRGRSIRRAREIMRISQFGFGAFAIGIMLLTHPERLQNYDDLWIDCSGDEFACIDSGDCSNAPFICFTDGKACFGVRNIADTSVRYGSASGFLFLE